MMRRLLLIVLIVTVGSLLGIAQTGAIKITMIDKLKNEPMPFASVQIEQGGNKISANQTNFDGEVTFSNLTPGKYDVKASFVGYNTKQVNGVQVSTDKTTYYKFEMENAGGVVLKEVQVVDYAKPLI